MAKPETAKKEKTEKKPAAKTEAPEFKYGVEDVADGLGIKAASARVQLRNHEIAKAGKSYGWNTKAEVEEIVKQLKGDGEKKKEKPKAEKSKTEKPKAKEVKKDAA